MRGVRIICLLLTIFLAATSVFAADKKKKTGSGLLTIKGEKDGREIVIYLHVDVIPLWTKDELEAIEWEELKGRHFIVYFTGMSKQNGKLERIQKIFSHQEQFAKNVLEAAEEYYTTITDKLGFGRRKSLWSWGKRTDLYLFPDNAAYLQLAGRPKWSAGFVDVKENKISGYSWKDEADFINSVLPHEIGHLIFRDFMEFRRVVPLWLDEGVAQWCEKSKVKVAKVRAKKWLLNKKLMPIERLMSIRAEQLREQMNWSQADQWYLQCLSLVDFMITVHGNDRFKKFCGQLKARKKINEALRFAYPTKMRDLEALNEQWHEYIEECDLDDIEIYVRL